jgi:ferredoxin
MLTSTMVKDVARHFGADLVGVASMDRFEGAPLHMDPRQIFPDANAAVVLGFRILRGCFRGIEEGTYFASLAMSGYSAINVVWAPTTVWNLCKYLEDNGYEAVPITNVESRYGFHYPHDTARPAPDFYSEPVGPGKPAPDVMVNLRFAAVAAGLGEIGYSKLLLTPQFGPRQRLAMLLTDAPLEPDPLFNGQLCDRCMACAEECAGQAISDTETIEVDIAGKPCQWGKLDTNRCGLAYAGGVKEASPFLSPELEAQMDVACPRESILKIPYNRRGRDDVLHHQAPIEGARGCMRACMIHLEQQGRLTNQFQNRFRTRPPWRLKSTPK